MAHRMREMKGKIKPVVKIPKEVKDASMVMRKFLMATERKPCIHKGIWLWDFGKELEINAIERILRPIMEKKEGE